MRFHLFPFRTEKLSSLTPMVLRFSRGRVGSRLFKVRSKGLTFFCVRMAGSWGGLGGGLVVLRLSCAWCGAQSEPEFAMCSGSIGRGARAVETVLWCVLVRAEACIVPERRCAPLR